MKILQVNNVFSPVHGGSAKIPYHLSKELARRGHEVTVYTSDSKLTLEHINSIPQVSVHAFKTWLDSANLFVSPGIIKKAKEETAHFDIIHMHSYRTLQNIAVHHYAEKYGIPYILDTHGSLPRIQGKRDLKCLLRWLFDVTFGYNILKGASRVIAQNELAISEYKEAGISPERIVMLPLAFDTEEFSQVPPSNQFRKKYGIKEKHIIMFLGRINWIKGLDFLVESFYELTRLRDNVILAIVGPDDGYKATLEKEIDKLGLSDKVLFTGFLGGEEKLSALVDADIVIQPSRYEQAAWAPIEAVLCGTPIIVTKHTGSAEDVSRIDAGYLVEYGNKKELTETMQRILDAPSEARAKARKAIEYIRANLSMTKRIEDYERLYIECIKENKQLRSKK